jgi:hypothetical protein
VYSKWVGQGRPSLQRTYGRACPGHPQGVPLQPNLNAPNRLGFHPENLVCTCPEITCYSCNQFTPDLLIEVQSYYWTSTLENSGTIVVDDAFSSSLQPLQALKKT